MKKALLILCALLLTGVATAQKSVYIPTQMTNEGYDASTTNNNTNKKWSRYRSRENDNIIVFWENGYGNNDPNSSSVPSDYRVDVDDMLSKLNTFYDYYVNTLGFADLSNSKLSRYKMVICLYYTTDWMAYGSGFDNTIGGMWVSPSTCHPVGETIAHELGHSFQYQCYCDLGGYAGFRYETGQGSAWWEGTANWQAACLYPDIMYTQSGNMNIYDKAHNTAMTHEWMRYQSYWMYYWWVQNNDWKIIGRIWRSGQNEGEDPNEIYMRLKGWNVTQLYKDYMDAAMHFVTWDFTNSDWKSRGNAYIGNFVYRSIPLGDNEFQVDYFSCPQATGYNVIELQVPTANTTVTTTFTALTPGCLLNDDDPHEYWNGEAVATANTHRYNSFSNSNARGFRLGYVALKSDGTRLYQTADQVYCTGTDESSVEVSYTVPSGVEKLWLVVCPAPTQYFRHLWNENPLDDDQWPYKVKFTNTTLDEQQFVQKLDGRDIADVTLTYDVTLPPDASGYTSASISLAGAAQNALCTAFQLDATALNAAFVTPTTSGPANGQIMGFPCLSNGTVNYTTTSANGTFGHWFNASGGKTDWGNGYTFSEYYTAGRNFAVGQYPGRNPNGTTRTIRQAMVYKNSAGQTATAYFIFNIKFETGASAAGKLTYINYTGTGGGGTTPDDETWPGISELPDDYSKYFFIFRDHYDDLFLTLRNGANQGGEYKTMWYSSQTTDLPENNKASLWTIDAYGDYQIIANATEPHFMLQTEWNASWHYRTHDNGGGDLNWGRTIISFDSNVATIQNGTYPDQGYLGPWNDNIVDNAEVALNKSGASIGNFDIAKILRGAYVAQYDSHSTATYDNPLDITYVLENPGAERTSSIGWKHENDDWTAQTNNSLNGKVGGRYFERWNGNGIGNADLYQEISGLPDGYYRFSAIATVNGDGQGFSIYANSDTKAVSTANNGSRFNVVAHVTDGELRVGLKAESVTAQWVAFDDAKLEYLGTELPAYNVGTPVISIADDSYIQQLSTVTFDYNEATASSGTFAILNSNAKAVLKKNGATVAEGTLTLSDKTLTATFSNFTLDTDANYTLTLPADVVGYAGHASNVESSLTLHTPVLFDGTFYLYNTYTNQYLSRGASYGTRARLDDWGLAINILTNAEGKTMLRYFDSQQYLYVDGWCYGDGNEAGALKFTVSKTGSDYKFLNQNNNRYLAMYDGYAVGDAAEGDNLVGTSNVWRLESTADHVANYTRCADAQAATVASSVAALSGITTLSALESRLTSDYHAVSVKETERREERYQWYASNSDPTNESEYYKETVENVKPGLYRLSVDAFQRAAWFDDVANADGARGCIYLYANGAKTQLKSVMEHYSDTAYDQDWQRDGKHYVNGIPNAFTVLDGGYYSNVVYVYVPADEGKATGTITFGINNPNRLGQYGEERGTWCCYNTFRLERLIPKVTLSETAASAPATTTDAYVTFNRAMKANQWNTICFPFAMDADQIETYFGEGTVVKELESATKNGENASLRFSAVTAIEPNTPYIMKPTVAGTTYTFEGIDVNVDTSDELTVTKDGVSFIGNYVYPTVIPAGDYYIQTKEGEGTNFYSSPGTTKLKGFRGYFHANPASGIKALTSKFDDDTVGIEALDVQMDLDNAEVFDLSGRRVHRPSKGFYIVNGKKVFIK